MLQTTILQNIEQGVKQLPSSLQIEVLHYIEFLKSNYAKPSNQNNAENLAQIKPKKRDGFGIWQGKIAMSEDFDAPMEEFESICKYERTFRYPYIYLVHRRKLKVN
ncbi:MAG: DUF2281 domain-containing protein [Pseudanabaena sp.]